MIRFIFILSIFCKISCFAEYKYQLSVSAIFQDEAPYLKEWIEFHRIVGVEHFYLYNHLSKDHFQEVLKPYIASGLVQLEDKPIVVKNAKEFTELQANCCNECLRTANGISKWVAFIDIDEFLFPVKEQTLLEVIDQYCKFGGLGVSWRTFGTSNIKKIPKDKLLLESLTACSKKSSPVNQSIKCILMPKCTSHFLNIHEPILINGSSLVNTDKMPIEGPSRNSYIQLNKLCINHYWTRDEEYFINKKIPRQKKWGGKPDAQQILFHLNAEQDTTIFRFVPALRKAMASTN